MVTPHIRFTYTIFSTPLNESFFYFLDSFIIDIKEKNCNANADPTITLETESTAVVSGNNGLGYVVGMFCMNLAIKKAAKTGIAMVVANIKYNLIYLVFFNIFKRDFLKELNIAFIF